MLRETFVHLPGIGLETERRLWEQGCSDWAEYLGDQDYVIGTASREATRQELRRSVSAFERGEHQYFARKLRQRHAWRAWPAFRDSCVYLDIETDGTVGPDSVTMIGLYDGAEFRCLIKGDDIESFRDVVSHYSMIVTFFGAGFDLPMLLKRFPGLVLDQIHLDLCTLFRALEIRGGLKKIERDFEIRRSPETDGLSGFDAVRLWREYLRGREASLDVLIAYNREDVVNLEPLMQIAFDRLREATLRGENRGPRRRKSPRLWV